MNVVILDTGCANLNSVKSAIARHGYEPKVSRDPDVVLLADKLFLPGVGTAQAAMDQVRERELFDLIKACTQPVLGICLGMQLACVEFARNVVGLEDADSAETNPACKNNIIDLMPDQENIDEMGGTLRLGLYPCELKEGTLAKKLYHNADMVQERHRHRYEFNNAYREALAEKGMVFSGVSPDQRLVEIVELKNHPFYIAAQFHPEFISRPDRPQPIFDGFIAAALVKIL